MRIRTQRLALAATAALALTLSACGGDSGTTDATDGAETETSTETDAGGDTSGETLNIGIKYDQPGLGLREGADFTGFDVDVARAVAEKLGYSEDQLTFVESVSSQRETMLQNGQVDMIFATYSITDSRKETVDFAGPYFVAGQDLLVRADDSEITGPDAMSGKTLCSVEGSTSAERIRTDYAADVELYPAQTYSECVEFLSAGTVDAVTTDDIILAGFAAQPAFEGQLKVVGETFSEENYGVGLPKGSDQCEAINEAITEIVEDGTWEQLLEDNMGADYAPNADLNPPTPDACA